MNATPTKLPPGEIDALDRKILAILQEEGRASNAEIAERVALSPSACHRRIRRLQELGVIDRFAALLNPRLLGRPTTVFVEISLVSQAEEVLADFEAAVRQVPDVLECHLMAGTADYILKIVAADTEDFARIHQRSLSRLPGVARMHSSFSLRTVVKTTALPLDD